MDIEFKMPDLATTDSEIKVIRWLVEPGAVIRRGQALLEVETDKAMMEVESIASGVLKTAGVKPGDAIVAGQLIAVIHNESVATPAPPPASGVPAKPAVSSTAAASRPAGGMFARNRAAAAGNVAAAGAVESSILLTATQRTVGRRMQQSKQNAPHFYLQASVNAEPMIRRRSAAEPARLAWDAFFVQAVARALKKFSRLACRFEGDHLTPAACADVGVAVDHEGDLYVVALSDPAARSVTQISAELRGQVEKLRAGDAEARRLRPTAITVTNLGASRVEAFAAIVNPPEAAILAIGRVAPAAAVEGGVLVVQQRVTITLSADHRVVNGKYAADFLTEIIRELESP